MPSLKETMKIYPELTTHGFGVDRGWNDDFEVERRALESFETEFRLCTSWLEKQTSINTPNRKIGSTYRLKHLVERSVPNTYIPEGVLIAAALALKISFSRIPKKTSIYLGISSRLVS